MGIFTISLRKLKTLHKFHTYTATTMRRYIRIHEHVAKVNNAAGNTQSYLYYNNFTLVFIIIIIMQGC